METTGESGTPSALPHPTRQDACTRCGGLMVVAHHVNLQGYAGEVIFKGLRCTNCGEFIDEMVLSNRLMPLPRALEGPKQRKFPRQVSHERSSAKRRGAGK